MTYDEAVDLVRGLVAVPSLSRQERNAATWLAGQMHAYGYDRAFVDEAGNAVGEIGPADAARVVVLLGHIDTVPGDIPVRIEGRILHGRGSVDAKGPLATFAAAGARLGSRWAHDAGVKLVVVGAVEEESATSKGARHVAARFDGRAEPVPAACVIGEPSSWRRITLGYKGRLLLDLTARQAMAHTAGPDASVAEAIVDLWNRVRAHADRVNTGIEKPFDQLSPSLRRFVTANADGLTDTVDAQFAWRLPVGFDAAAFANELVSWSASVVDADGTPPAVEIHPGAGTGAAIQVAGRRTSMALTFRGWERPWRGDRQNALVRSFLSAVREVDTSAQPGFVVKTGTSDMNVVAPLWQCPIVAYGPGDSALDHTPHEHLDLDEYWRAVRVLESALRRLAGSEGSISPEDRLS
jgi:LysW-gamma-L-lysine carboxypeptidase